jgi:hypothetical protein
LRETHEADERERVFHRNGVLFHLRNLQDPSRRIACLGALAALALFEGREPRRRGLAEALERFAGRPVPAGTGLSDAEILERVGGRASSS